MSVPSQETRRQFLKFLVGSPLLACAGISALSIQQLLAQGQQDTPIILAPAGSQKAFHDEGEIAVARAVKSRNAL